MSDNGTYSIARLGFVATHGHKVKDGSRYDKYFPKINGKYEIVVPNGTVRRTIKEMDDFCRETLVDTEKIAPLLRGKSLVETCKNVFNFWFEHCKYKLDKAGTEELRRPRRAWHDGQILARNPYTADQAGIDCDCFTIAVASTLLNLDITCKFRVTKYDADWQHVYVAVPLPEDPTHYYAIDCVLDRFNEEKTYTDKIDHKMEAKTFLGGIPIARLSGLGCAASDNLADLNRILDGCHFNEMDRTISGLGDASGPNSPMLKHIYDHLVATRDYVRKNPDSVDVIGGAKNHLKMLDYAIANFYTNKREAALDALEKAEEKWNGVASMGTVEDAEDTFLMGLMEEDFATDSEDPEDAEILHGLGKGFLKKAADKVKANVTKVTDQHKKIANKVVDQHKTAGQKFFSNVKTAVKAVDNVNRKIVKEAQKIKTTVDNKVKAAAQKAIVKTKEVAKKAGALIKQFLIMSNPLTLVMRAGFLLMMKENVFHMAERLLPALLTQSEAAKRNVNEALWKKTLVGFDKVAKIFEGIGGKRKNLEKAIKTGRASKKKGLAGLGALGEAYSVVAAIVAAAGVVVAAIGKMAQAGITKRAAKDQYAHEEKMAAIEAQNKSKKKKSSTMEGFGEDGAEGSFEEIAPEESVDPTSIEDKPIAENSGGSEGSDGSEIMDEIPADISSEAQKQGWGKKLIEAVKRWFSRKKKNGESDGSESAQDVIAEEQASAQTVDNSSVATIEAKDTAEGDATEAAAWKAAEAAGLAAAQSGASEGEAVSAARNAYVAAGGKNPDQFGKEQASVADLQAAAKAAAEKAAASKAAYEALAGGSGIMKFIKNNPGTTAAIAVGTVAVLAFAFDVFGIRTKLLGPSKPKAKLAVNGLGQVVKYRKGKKVKKSKKFLTKGSHVKRIVMK